MITNGPTMRSNGLEQPAVTPCKHCDRGVPLVNGRHVEKLSRYATASYRCPAIEAAQKLEGDE